MVGGLPGAPAFTDGGVTGTLDANNLAMTNYTSSLNDYGENVVFGGTLSFEVTFNLPAILTGNSGSELEVQLTQSDLLTPILTSDPSGNIVEISYDQTGAFTPNPTSALATITPLNSVPEPGESLVLLAALLAGWRFVRVPAARSRLLALPPATTRRIE